MGHHNLCDSAATDGVQKGEDSGALPVDPTASVSGGLGVTVLMGGANATAWLRFFVETNLVFEVGKAVETLACPAFNFALLSPAAKSAGADIVALANSCATHVLWIQ